VADKLCFGDLLQLRDVLFCDGRCPRRAWPVLGEYIRRNVYPRKSNFPSGIWQIRVLSWFTVLSAGDSELFGLSAIFWSPLYQLFHKAGEAMEEVVTKRLKLFSWL
jgi:hypothetical protein